MTERALSHFRVAGVLLLLLLPIWGLPYFLTQDGPTHVENARILLDYHKPEFDALRVFYFLKTDPVPNWLSHLALAGLMTIVDPLTAEKLFLSVCVLGLTFGFRYALGAIAPRHRDSWPLILPFVYNHFLHLGFYNFAFAAIPYFILLGYFFTHDRRWGGRTVLGLWLLLLAIYFCHLVTFLLALGALGVLGSASSLADVRGHEPDRLRLVIRRGLGLAVAALPGALLTRWFLGSLHTEPSAGGPSAARRWTELWQLRELASHRHEELWLSSFLAILLASATVFVLLVKVRRRRWGRRDGLLVLSAAYAAVYFLIPVTVLRTPGGTAGGGTTHDRVSLYVFFALLLWLGAQEMGTRWRRALVTLSVLISVALVTVRWPTYVELNRYLTEYLSPSRHLTHQATLLTLSYAHRGRRPDRSHISWRVKPFLHSGAYLAVDNDLVDFTNYEADLTYFPTAFRPKANPYTLLRKGLEGIPPCVALRRYDRLGPRPLDFILLWQPGQAPRGHGCVKAVFRHLDAHYDLVATSAPRGLSTLYRRKPAPVDHPEGRR